MDESEFRLYDNKLPGNFLHGLPEYAECAFFQGLMQKKLFLLAKYSRMGRIVYGSRRELPSSLRHIKKCKVLLYKRYEKSYIVKASSKNMRTWWNGRHATLRG